MTKKRGQKAQKTKPEETEQVLLFDILNFFIYKCQILSEDLLKAVQHDKCDAVMEKYM